ncbi:MAG: Stage V sporulation protein AF (SpoVAF) [Firmicutes bacterium]|nr:Stage V sporulation protein AF (SpoVAF) [Bacillota bacterium]MDI6706438.1 spore germination protein [Bacillota bacterium]
MKLEKNIKRNIEILDRELGIEKSFDIVNREFQVGGKTASLIFVDGFAKDDVMLWIMQELQHLGRGDIVPNTVKKIVESGIGYLEVETTDQFEDVMEKVLAGPLALLIDGICEAIIIDAREYPVRQPEESELEKVTRGSRDGLVETIVFNTALIRRRIRDPKLRNELMQVGTRSKTDVVVSYIEDIANPNLVNLVKKKIKSIETDSLVMGEKTLEEFIVGRSWNPLPQAKFTERPDVAAAHLLEGHIAVIVDTSPSVMILPVCMFHFTQHAEDYYQNPTIGTYLRWVRLVSMFLSLVLPALWLIAVEYRESLPPALKFLGAKGESAIPLFIQFLVLEVGIDMLRLASIHTPNALTTSLGIIGALLLGELAVKVGWFVPETILYIAIAGIGSFATPSIEFALAIRLFRLILLILTGMLKGYGFLLGLLFFIIIITTTKSMGGVRYTWPLIPFDWKALSTILFRKPVPEVKMRPDFLRTIDKDDAPG